MAEITCQVIISADACASLVAHMRAHKPDCKICEIIENKMKGKGPHEKIIFYFTDKQLRILRQVSENMVKGLGDLLEQFGMADKFTFEGIK
jgi:hypothetical protein